MAKLTKNRGRSRFFSCYGPVGFNDDTTIIKRGYVYNSKDSSNLKRVRSQEKLDSISGKDFTKNFRQNRKENVFGRNFSAALKNMFSDTSLGIKKCQRKEPKCSFGPYKKLSSKFEKMFHSMNETKSSSKDLSNINRMSRTSMDDFSLFTTSTASSSFSSSSSSSSSPSSCAASRSTSGRKQIFPSFHRSRSMNNMQVYDNIKEKEKEIALRYNKNVGTYSLLICLLVMIFCGKVFAIVCTSTWFYFAPRCFKRIDSSVKGFQYSHSLEIDSNDNNNIFSVIPQVGLEMIGCTQTLSLLLCGREADSNKLG